jgi:hypothetical protein
MRQMRLGGVRRDYWVVSDPCQKVKNNVLNCLLKLRQMIYKQCKLSLIRNRDFNYKIRHKLFLTYYTVRRAFSIKIRGYFFNNNQPNSKYL